MFGKVTSRRLLVAMLAAALFTSVLGRADAERKVISKVQPAYPQLARQLNLSGTVKVAVVIAANGVVKAVKPLGGHPLLIQSASDAVRKWRYAPGPEQTVIVEFQFHAAE